MMEGIWEQEQCSKMMLVKSMEWLSSNLQQDMHQVKWFKGQHGQWPSQIK